MAKLKFYKLGEKASAFFDAKTRLKVVNGVPGKLAIPAARTSRAIKIAVSNGHLKEIEEAEYTEMISSQKGLVKEAKEVLESSKVATDATSEISKADFENMNKSVLLSYYMDNYETDKEDQDDFKALNKSQMVDKLMELEDQED